MFIGDKSDAAANSKSWLQRVHDNHIKPTTINKQYEPLSVRYKPIDKTVKKFRCVMCGTDYTTQPANFPSGGTSPLWKGNGGYLPFCKDCCEAIFENLIEFFSGNEEKALDRVCQIFDWYYSEWASAATLNQGKFGKHRVILYPGKMRLRQATLHGQTYLDNIMENGTERIMSVVEERPVTESSTAEPKSSEENEFVVTKEMMRVWGAGFTKEQYQYLEEEYQDWITKNVCNTKSQEEIYRNIVLAQLDIRTARERGGKVSDAQRTLQDLMNSANVLPKQTADNILADTQTFATLLKKYEETSPLPEADEKWQDVDGIRKYMNTWFKGGLAKALKLKGVDNVKLFEEAVEEMEKYTVSPNKENLEATEISTTFFGVGAPADEEESVT